MLGNQNKKDELRAILALGIIAGIVAYLQVAAASTNIYGVGAFSFLYPTDLSHFYVPFLSGTVVLILAWFTAYIVLLMLAEGFETYGVLTRVGSFARKLSDASFVSGLVAIMAGIILFIIRLVDVARWYGGDAKIFVVSFIMVLVGFPFVVYLLRRKSEFP